MNLLYEAPLTANPLVWLGGYIVLAFALSYYWIWHQKREALFWKMTEFVWLATAAIGLVAAASQVRQSNAEFREPDAKNSVDVALDQLRTGLSIEETRTCGVPPRAGKQGEQAGREAVLACQWFREVGRNLPTLPPADPREPMPVYFAAPAPTLGIPQYAATVKSVGEQIGALRRSRVAHAKAKEEAGRGPVDFLMAPLAALFLAIALAVRTAKAIAEYCAEREKQREAGPAKAPTEGGSASADARSESSSTAVSGAELGSGAPSSGDAVPGTRITGTLPRTPEAVPVKADHEA